MTKLGYGADGDPLEELKAMGLRLLLLATPAILTGLFLAARGILR